MVSRLGMLRLVLYISIGILVLGVTLVGLSFTKISRKTLDMIKKGANKEQIDPRISPMAGSTILTSNPESKSSHDTSMMRQGGDADIPGSKLDELEDIKAGHEQDLLTLRFKKLTLKTHKPGMGYQSDDDYTQLIKDIHDKRMSIQHTDDRIKFEEQKARTKD